MARLFQQVYGEGYPIRTYYLPNREELAYLYSGLGVARSFIRVQDGLSSAGDSLGRMEVYAAAQVARIAVPSIGANFERFIAQREREARGQGVAVFQVRLPLTSPHIGAATEVLRGQGYFPGGALPRWIDQDTLLMQKVTDRPDWPNIRFYSERAQRIGDIVRSDWERTA